MEMHLAQAATTVRPSDRFALRSAAAGARHETFAEDVRTGLTATPKYLLPKYFYDDLGSALFEAICELPEYYLTRAEAEILTGHVDEMLATVGADLDLFELGSGSARKSRLVIARAIDRQGRLDYHPIDVSSAALVTAATSLLGEFAALRVVAHVDDYFEVLRARSLRGRQRALVLFLGSNIGNYDPAHARALLAAMSLAFASGDALLLGTDLKKAAATLESAYDDPTGVTAAFNKNVLGRIDRELAGEFDLRAFRHVAHYDPERGSVDSFLESMRAQTVRIGRLGMAVDLAAGERIHTESSYKFALADVERLAAQTGWRLERSWTDAAGRFAVSLLRLR